MASENHGAIVRSIDRVFNRASATGLTEGQLLSQFATWGDESAFEALVTRHGPMVLAVCRRLLYDPRDIEDAFQATFLVLCAGPVRCATTNLSAPGCMALRIGSPHGSEPARPGGRSRSAKELAPRPWRPPPTSSDMSCEAFSTRRSAGCRRSIGGRWCSATWRVKRTSRLRRLRCTEGAVRGRLDRARERLKTRLTRRGVAPLPV